MSVKKTSSLNSCSFNGQPFPFENRSSLNILLTISIPLSKCLSSRLCQILSTNKALYECSKRQQRKVTFALVYCFLTSGCKSFSSTLFAAALYIQSTNHVLNRFYSSHHHYSFDQLFHSPSNHHFHPPYRASKQIW